MNDNNPPAAKNLYSMAFFDVQNLFRHAKDAFQQVPGDGYHHPNFDPILLHKRVAAALGFTPNLTRFYTGIPTRKESPMWADYWSNRVIALNRKNVKVATRPLRYYRHVEDDGTVITVPQEKGIDIRIALDLVRCTLKKEFDVAIIFSQDQDLHEVVSEIHGIARDQDREIIIISAFPESQTSTAKRGIDGTRWFKIDKAFYDACIDPYDYRVRRS